MHGVMSGAAVVVIFSQNACDLDWPPEVPYTTFNFGMKAMAFEVLWRSRYLELPWDAAHSSEHSGDSSSHNCP